MKDQKEAIKSVLSSILAGAEKEGQSLLDAVADDPMVQAARQAAQNKNPDGFYFAFSYPIKNLAEAIVKEAIPGSHKAQFLMAHSDFVSAHFDKVFSKLDGKVCAHDKTKTVIRALMRFFTEGTEIAFNYEQEYTYGLPKRVLKTHESILAFFDGLHHMYYGTPDYYFIAMQNILAEHAAAVRAEEGGDEGAELEE